jgi:hypothetical protein
VVAASSPSATKGSRVKRAARSMSSDEGMGATRAAAAVVSAMKALSRVRKPCGSERARLSACGGTASDAACPRRTV